MRLQMASMAFAIIGFTFVADRSGRFELPQNGGVALDNHQANIRRTAHFG